MSVKTIFKTLIGTIAIIIISSVVIEFFNVNVTSALLSQYTRLAVKQSCVLFSQETYRNSDPMTGYTGAVNQKEILAEDDTVYSTYNNGSGSVLSMNNFYIGNNESEIWDSIYINNQEFKDGINEISSEIMAQSLNNYSNRISANQDEQIAARVPELASLKLMANASSSSISSISLPTISGNWWELEESDKRLINYNTATRARTYLTNRYTPINVGIPYMDKTVTTKMLQWHLTELLANNNKGAINRSEGAPVGGTGVYDYYVNFRGFAVYTRGAQITNYIYHICDLDTAEGRIKLQNLTGMQADGYGTGQGLKYKHVDIGSSPAHEAISNNLVFVVEVEYEVPVTYLGITPLKNIFNYVFNDGSGQTRAVGLDGSAGSLPSETYDTSAVMLTNNLNPDAKLATGKVYYTLVR